MYNVFFIFLVFRFSLLLMAKKFFIAASHFRSQIHSHYKLLTCWFLCFVALTKVLNEKQILMYFLFKHCSLVADHRLMCYVAWDIEFLEFRLLISDWIMNYIHNWRKYQETITELEVLVIAIVLVPEGCHNKEPQIRWLKTTEMYCLMVLEVRSSKSRCWQGHAPLEINRGILLCLFLACGGWWHFGIPSLAAA